MFIGHFGLAFGSKPVASRASLGTLFLAAQLVDLLWPSLLLAGIERVRIEPGITRVTPLDFTHYPFTHSLAAVALWGTLFGVFYWLVRRHRQTAWVLAALVVSHWILDLLTHRPDLPLLPGSGPKAGLGLWSSLWGTILVEGAIFAVGVGLYLRATRARDGVGRWALWGLVLFLLAVYVSNLLGPPPPNVPALAWVGQAQWLLVAWAYWVDRHREPRAE